MRLIFIMSLLLTPFFFSTQVMSLPEIKRIEPPLIPDIVIDYSLPSNTYRMFIHANNEPVDSFMVASGKTDKDGNVIFSNKHNSHSSSYGKALLGKYYRGGRGLSYKLHGIDSSNSNMYTRGVVIHASSCVPYTPAPIPCVSQGCVMMNPKAFREFHEYVKELNLKTVAILPDRA